MFSIQNLEFHSFIETVKIKDNNIRQAEAELKFVGTNANPDMKGKNNPERGLVRFQFQESLVRLAEEKYLKQGVCRTYWESVDKLYKEHCIEEFKKYDSQVFRDKYYWNEHCE